MSNAATAKDADRAQRKGWLGRWTRKIPSLGRKACNPCNPSKTNQKEA